LVGAGLAELRLVAAPFLAAADLAAADLAPAPRPVPVGRRALFPLDPAAPPRLDPLAPPRPPAEPLRPLPPRPLVPVPVPPLRAPDRLAEVRGTAPRPEPPPAAAVRGVPDVPERADLLDPPDDEPDPLPVPRLAPLLLAPRGGTLGRITSGDSSL
jgi:hypothetical protein